MIEKKVFFVKGRTKQRLVFVLLYLVLISMVVYLPYWIRSLLPVGNREITVFSLSDVIPESLFRKFEKESGIKVNNKYCDSDAEIWSQLYLSSGEGYDLITPTDYMAKTMEKDNLIQKFEFSSPACKVALDNVDKKFLTKKEDEFFSIPFAWSVHGLGYRKKFFVRRGLFVPESWSFLFEKPDWIGMAEPFKKYGVCLSDDPLDIAFISNIYLTGDVSDFSPANIERIVELLVKQKSIVKACTNSNVVYYLMHICPLVLAISAHMKIPLEQQEEALGFTVPNEGGLISVQHLAIPKQSKNVDLAIDFINFLLRDENGIEMFNKKGFFPVTLGALEQVKTSNLEIVQEVFKKNKPLMPLNDKLKLPEAYKIMMRVKSL